MSRKTAELENAVFGNESKALWVFAYGSLCWKPGFEFSKAIKGHVKGYSRKFWQGNTTHRGTEEKPGRVATLVRDDKESVCGLAFAISGEAAIPYLSKRECKLGGYASQFTHFYPLNGEPFNVLVYVATPQNKLWLGDGHIETIAEQITETSGPSGHNVEYIVRLADFMREHFSDQNDPHLYHLERQVLTLVKRKNMCLDRLMGSGEDCVTFIQKDNAGDNLNNNNNNNQERIDTFEHTTRVPEKTLRCLNI